MEDTALIGMKAICEYTQYSPKKITELVENHGFPAVKIGGNWESDKMLIKKWRQWKIKELSGFSCSLD